LARDAFGFEMQITLNGEKRDIPDGLTVEALLEHLEIKPGRVAVEINETIVRKATYAETLVKDGDRVEVVQFMGGGGAASPRLEIANWKLEIEK
jgi:thiamine biosynthesis protein ThiS